MWKPEVLFHFWVFGLYLLNQGFQKIIRNILLCLSKVEFNNSSLLINPFWSCAFPQYSFFISFQFLSSCSLVPGEFTYCHLCPFANTLWQVLNLTPRRKCWHYFNNRLWSRWLCSRALTITGVMCGWCPSGQAASLNGWRRVTGCRGDALLMRKLD